MYKISDDIINSVSNELSIDELSDDVCSSILGRVALLFVDANRTGTWLWEKLGDSEELADSKGWSYIQDFVSNDSCIMFFNQDDEKRMFKISNGKDLQYVLSETSGYEFYITDAECSYLLCFNHHDILIGCGKAKSWIQELKGNSMIIELIEAFYNDNIELQEPNLSDMQIPKELHDILTKSDGIMETMIVPKTGEKVSIGWIIYPYERILEETAFFNDEYGIEGTVFSDDGAGNPYYILDNKIYQFNPIDNESELKADSLEDFYKK